MAGRRRGPQRAAGADGAQATDDGHGRRPRAPRRRTRQRVGEEEEVQEKRKLDQLTSHIIVSNYSYKTVQKCFSCLVGRNLNTLPYMNDQ